MTALRQNARFRGECLAIFIWQTSSQYGAQGNVMGLSKVWMTLAILGIATPAFSQGAPTTLPLSSVEIRHSLIGKLIDYSPPGWADADVSEQFHEDGKWQGAALSRGPIPFSGRWSIEADKLCVVSNRGSFAEKWHAGKYCRQVWKNKHTGQLLMAHLTGFKELQILSVRDPKTLKVER